MDVVPIMKEYPGRLLAAFVAALLGCAIIACSPETSQPEYAEFTADEGYLIDAYVEVKRAHSHYPYQTTVAESLFAALGASIDTVRIANTITALNLTPDRWAAVYREIEDRMRKSGRDEASERAGAGPGAPAQVEEDDERH